MVSIVNSLPSETNRDPATILFVGKLDYFPHAQAVHRLVTAILPLVIRRRSMSSHSGGSNPSSKIHKLSVLGRIEVTGYVEDIRPYLHRATVVLTPLLAGIGFQNKVLEALASGAPVVASRLACQGLKVVPGERLLIAERPNEFSDRTLQLLDDAALRRKLAVEGPKLVVD